MFKTFSIIAADFNGTVGNTDFWQTGLGKILATMMGVVGILVVVYSILKTVKNVASGKVGEAVKGIIGAVLLAAVLFNPPLIQNAIKAGGKVINSAIETVSSIGDAGNNGGGSNTPSTPTSPAAPAVSGTTPAAPATTAPAAPATTAPPAPSAGI